MDSDAAWSPLYDLHAYSQDGKPSTSVSLHYRVNLFQCTGENWNNAKLVLSTSDTNILNAGIPRSVDLVVEPKPKLPPPQVLGRRRRSNRTKQTARRKADAEPDEEDELDDGTRDRASLGAGVLPEMSEGGAAISKSLMAVNYTVDNRTTIPSNEESHKVLVATIPLEASISHVTTPRKSPLAYLQVSPVTLLVSRFTDRAVNVSAPSKIRASIPFFLEHSTYSSTIRTSPRRRYLRLGPETHSTALSGWTHQSRFQIPSRRHQ